jgi:hypothetical protein
MRSSTLAVSESYFTTASWFAKETFASFTPVTFSSADCTAEAQEPHVIPLISSVTVSSLASALGENTSVPVSTTKTTNNALRCIWRPPTRDYITTESPPADDFGRRAFAVAPILLQNRPAWACGLPPDGAARMLTHGGSVASYELRTLTEGLQPRRRIAADSLASGVLVQIHHSTR